MTPVKSCLTAALAAMLCACAGSPPLPAPPARIERDWLAQIQREAALVDSAVDVVPLPDPEVDDLRQRAASALRAGRYDEAEADLRAAIALRDADPALWQSLAEVAIGKRQWADAAAHAQASYQLGPKVGALCVRNWFTLLASSIEGGDAPGAAAARAQVQRCIIAKPTRF